MLRREEAQRHTEGVARTASELAAGAAALEAKIDFATFAGGAEAVQEDAQAVAMRAAEATDKAWEASDAAKRVNERST
eukprot:1236127-Prymnesium_polylepis.1